MQTFSPNLHAQNGFLRIDNYKSGYKIVLDDSVLIHTLTNVVLVDTGWHNVTVLNPRRGIWNFNDWADSIHIAINDTAVISPVFSKPLNIQSDPFDAQVFLNDSLIGTTPLHIELNADATGVIRIQKDFYTSITFLLDSLNSGTINIELPLQSNEKSLFEQSIKTEQKSVKHRQITTISLMAFTVFSGITTAYLKDQAEQRYEKYMTAGDPASMNRYLDESKRLDKYAAISMGVFEVSFTVSFISLFRTVAH
ncbi:hypothetical protein JW960_15580 [candidate division KSB1 bacterium]|nr:hypothetical protein [candidate division KSB1 bacterium]